MVSRVTPNQDQVNLAAQQEENERLGSQVKYFSERVVLLRALLNAQQEEIENLRAQLDTIQPETKEDENDGSAD